MNLKRSAEIISYALHPFVMVAVVTIVSAVSAGGLLYSAGSLLLILLLVLIPLSLFIRHKVKNKKWENIDASNKSERPSFYLTTIGILLVLVIFLSIFSVFIFLIKGTLSVIILLVIHFLLNKYIKASLHTSFAVFTAIVVYSFYPAAGFVLAVFIPVLIWARLQLKRHTASEIGAGILIGALCGLITVFI